MYFVNTVHQYVVSYLAYLADSVVLYTYQITIIYIKC
jgi:hypothetical protein